MAGADQGCIQQAEHLLRPADGVPTSRSAWPVERWSSARNPDNTVMNSGVPLLRLRARSPAETSAPRLTGSAAPRNVCTAGRGRSAGSSSTGA